MAYNPTTATREEKWQFRMHELKELLDGIPFTKTQRILVDLHVKELREIFIEAQDAAPPEVSKQPHGI